MNEVLDFNDVSKVERSIPPGQSHLSIVSIGKDIGVEWVGRHFRFWIEGKCVNEGRKAQDMYLRFVLV